MLYEFICALCGFHTQKQEECSAFVYHACLLLLYFYFFYRCCNQFRGAVVCKFLLSPLFPLPWSGSNGENSASCLRCLGHAFMCWLSGLFVCVVCINSHLLLPQQWREFAKEMDGVIRIGAVNCGDNGRLCRSKGVNSYPSLYMFKAGMVRVNPVMQRVKVSDLQWQFSFDETPLPNRMPRSTLETDRKRAWLSLPCSLWRAESLSFGKVSTSTSFYLHAL